MTSPTSLGALKHGMHRRDVCSSKDFCIRDFVLPSDVQKLPQAYHVKVVEFLGMHRVDCPSLTCIKEGSDDSCDIDLELSA